jgi:hypothetical protein
MTDTTVSRLSSRSRDFYPVGVNAGRFGISNAAESEAYS